MALSGRASKAKGYRGEVEVLQMLETIMREEYLKAGRGCPPELSRSPSGRDIRGIPWIALEVKRREPSKNPDGTRKDDWNPCVVNSWWEQTKTNTLAGQESVLIYRKNHSPWEVRMFGKLHTERAAIKAPVDISLLAFLTWFRIKLRETLTPAPSAQEPA